MTPAVSSESNICGEITLFVNRSNFHMSSYAFRMDS